MHPAVPPGMAAVPAMEPIFEADLPPEQHACRDGRRAHDAVRRVHGLVCDGYGEVIEVDMAGYLTAIAHVELMRPVARRVSDRHLLALLKQWPVAAVQGDDGRGGWKRTTRAKDETSGD